MARACVKNGIGTRIGVLREDAPIVEITRIKWPKGAQKLAAKNAKANAGAKAVVGRVSVETMMRMVDGAILKVATWADFVKDQNSPVIKIGGGTKMCVNLSKWKSRFPLTAEPKHVSGYIALSAIINQSSWTVG